MLTEHTGLKLAVLISTVLHIWLIAPAAPPAAHRIETKKQKPLWTVKLKPFGYRGFRRGIVNDIGSFTSIAFGSNTVALAFTTPLKDPVPLADPGSSRNQYLCRIVLLSFDARTGKQLGMASRDTSSLMFDLLPAPNDGFFLVTKEEKYQNALGRTDVTHYSPSLRKLGELNLSLRGKFQHEWWAVAASPTGRVLLISHIQDDASENFLVDPASLQPEASWMDDEHVLSISDSEVLRKGEGDLVWIRSKDTPWRSIKAIDGYPRFLSNNLIVLTKRSGQIHVSTTTGEKILSLEMSSSAKNVQVDPAVVSADGRRFAVVAESRHTGLGGLLGLAHVGVFVWQVPAIEPIFAGEVRRSSLNEPEIALSPDGTLLTIVSEGKLQLYQLPGTD